MNLSVLTKIPLFHSVPEFELERIFTELNITATTFRKGEILAMQDEPVNRLIILLTGSIKAEMTDASGRMAKVEDVEAPSPLAILFLFGTDNHFPVQVTAREDVTAAIIPRPAALRMLSMNETILKNYLDTSSNIATRLSRKLYFMSFYTIRQKLAVYLLDLSRKQSSDTVTLDRPKSALADYFCVARPSLEREMTHMQHDNLIAVDRGTITILNRRELATSIS